MRRSLLAFAYLFVLTLGACTLVDSNASEQVTAKDLLANPARFSGRLVRLSGRATAAGLRGGMVPTYNFSLDDGTQLVDVVARGAPTCQPTQRVTVEGWFRASTAPGFGHIEAISVTCR